MCEDRLYLFWAAYVIAPAEVFKNRRYELPESEIRRNGISRQPDDRLASCDCEYTWLPRFYRNPVDDHLSDVI